MPKLPVVSGKEVVKALQKIGFVIQSQRGSHLKLIRQSRSKRQIVIIPMHKSIKSGTLRNGILKPIGLSVEDLVKLLTKKN